jgi:hypothetical protein
MSSTVPEPPPALPAGPAGSARRAASPTGPAVAWALGVGLLATAGLALLAWGLLVLDAFAYGVARGFGPEAGGDPPDELRYATALATGACVILLGGPLLAWWAARGRSRTWHAVLVGIGAGLLAAAAGASAFLLVLGVDPVTFFLGS